MPPSTREAQALFARVEESLKASTRPELLTLLPTGRPLSGEGLARRIRRTASGLARVEIGAGSRVLLSVTHPYSLLLAVPALWSLGATPLLGEGGLTAQELSKLMARLSPDRVLADPVALPDTCRPVPGLSQVRIAAPPRLRPLSLPSGTVMVRMTSGSSGTPRGVALGASQVLSDTLNILRSLRIGPGVRTLAAVPMSHAYGFSTLLVPLLLHANPMVLLEKPLPEQFRAALERFNLLFFPGVPYLYDLLCHADIPRRRLARLGICISAGAPLSPSTTARFLRRSGRPIRNFYGTSECGAVATDQSRGGALPPGCVGRPLSGVRVFLESIPGLPSSPEAGMGLVGRVGVRSEAVALGYVGGGGRGRLRRGHFLTEDLGRLDFRGRLHLLGRLDQVINVGGLKVQPEEVERVLMGVAGVRETAVTAIPDPSRGQAVGAAVAGLGSIRSEDLLARCREVLSPHKVPRRILILPAMPRTVRGKVDRARLRSLLATSSGNSVSDR